MLTLALDPSSTATGWALFDGLQLREYGTVRRNSRKLVDYAAGIANVYFAAWARVEPPCDHQCIVYEINDTPMPRARQASLRKCHEATGRILQALGVEGEPVQADRKKKKQRRADMELIYKLEGRVSEHCIDAIALGHRVVNDPKRLEPRPD